MPHDLPILRTRRHSGTAGGLAGKFAERVHVTRAHAEQLVYGGNHNLRDRVIDWILTCRGERRADVLDKWMRPILEAYFEIRPEHYGPRILQEAAKAESLELVARTDWQLGEQRKDAYLRTLDRAIARMCELREALAAAR